MTRLWPKNPVTWMRGTTLCVSVVFTWQVEDAFVLGRDYHRATGGDVEIGGPAIELVRRPRESVWNPRRGWLRFPKVPKDDDGVVDVLGLMNPDATFTTRGCPNKCVFCSVPRIEGPFRELERWRPAPIVCDNNLLACSRRHFERVLVSLERFDRVDFNQGLDCRRLTSWHVGLLGQLRNKGIKVKVRFAFDRANVKVRLFGAIDRVLGVGIPRQDIGVYVLVGFRDTPEAAVERLETVRELGIRPNPMRYQPLTTGKKNSYVHKAGGWTERKLRDVMRYYSNLRYFGSIPFSEYRNTTIRSGE